MVEIESLAEDGKRRVVGGFWAKTHSISAGSMRMFALQISRVVPPRGRASTQTWAHFPCALGLRLALPIGRTTIPRRFAIRCNAQEIGTRGR